MVGRERELEDLTRAFARAAEDRSCLLFTVLGAAGEGKSRLVEEFLSTAGESAKVMTGRCLPYGEGITYWPVAEAIRAALGVQVFDAPEEVAARLDRVVAGDEHAAAIAHRLGEILGIGEGVGCAEEAPWAIRRFLEILAAERPLVAIWEDIHWAEPAFLDVVDHIVDWSRDAPIMLVCTARPEFLDARTDWGGGKLNATTLLLQPLDPKASAELIANLLGGAGLPAETSDRLTEAAGGNPLFVEQMLSMLIDDGVLVRQDGAWIPAGDLSSVAVPPSVAALLAARLERLTDDERRAIECARRDRQGVLRRRGPGPAPRAPPRRRIRPDPFADPQGARPDGPLDGPRRGGVPVPPHPDPRRRVPGDPQGAPRRAARGVRRVDRARRRRSSRGAGRDRRLPPRAGVPVPQALGPLDDQARRLARRASERLAAAGSRALARHDMRAVANLLGRAEALLDPSDPARLALLPDLSFALWEGGLTEEATALTSEFRDRAEDLGDPEIIAYATLSRWWLLSELERPFDLARSDAQDAIRVFEASGNERGLARAWQVIASVEWDLGQAGKQLDALEHALDHAGRARASFETAEAFHSVTAAIVRGPIPVPDGIARAEAS